MVTAFPHYPRGVIPSKYKRKILAIKAWNRVRIVRVWIPPLPHEGITKRLIMYVSFAVSALMALPLCRGAQVTWAMSPNYLCMVPATACKATTRSKVVHDVVDIWPKALRATGYSFSNSLLSMASLVSRLSYAFSDSIVTVSESMKRSLSEVAPMAVPIEVVENCVTNPFFQVPPKEKTSTLHIMYLGTLGPSNDFLAFVKAAKTLQHDEYARFTIAGSGEQAEKIGRWMKEFNVSNVTLFNQTIDHKEVPAWLAGADVLVLPMKTGFGDISLPGKLGEYLASGRPVICLFDGELAEFVRRNDIALLQNPSLFRGLGWKGRDYAQNHLSYDSFGEKIDNILELAAGVA